MHSEVWHLNEHSTAFRGIEGIVYTTSHTIACDTSHLGLVYAALASGCDTTSESPFYVVDLCPRA